MPKLTDASGQPWTNQAGLPKLGSDPQASGWQTGAWQRQMNLLRVRSLTQAGNLIGVGVATSATSIAITWARPEPDLSYGVVVTPNWNTTVWVPTATKLTTGVTIDFGTAAPANALVDISTFRSES